jgi:hypothetical protein
LGKYIPLCHQLYSLKYAGLPFLFLALIVTLFNAHYNQLIRAVHYIYIILESEFERQSEKKHFIIEVIIASVYPEFFLEGADPEAIYNLCLSLNIML